MLMKKVTFFVCFVLMLALVSGEIVEVETAEESPPEIQVMTVTLPPPVAAFLTYFYKLVGKIDLGDGEERTTTVFFQLLEEYAPEKECEKIFFGYIHNMTVIRNGVEEVFEGSTDYRFLIEPDPGAYTLTYPQNLSLMWINVIEALATMGNQCFEQENKFNFTEIYKENPPPGIDSKYIFYKGAYSEYEETINLQFKWDTSHLKEIFVTSLFSLAPYHVLEYNFALSTSETEKEFGEAPQFSGSVLISLSFEGTGSLVDKQGIKFMNSFKQEGFVSKTSEEINQARVSAFEKMESDSPPQTPQKFIFQEEYEQDEESDNGQDDEQNEQDSFQIDENIYDKIIPVYPRTILGIPFYFDIHSRCDLSIDGKDHNIHCQADILATNRNVSLYQFTQSLKKRWSFEESPKGSYQRKGWSARPELYSLVGFLVDVNLQASYQIEITGRILRRKPLIYQIESRILTTFIAEMNVAVRILNLQAGAFLEGEIAKTESINEAKIKYFPKKEEVEINSQHSVTDQPIESSWGIFWKDQKQTKEEEEGEEQEEDDARIKTQIKQRIQERIENLISELEDKKVKLGICGNSAVQGKEQCDDGNRNNKDGCNKKCGIEKGYSCSGEPSVCIQD